MAELLCADLSSRPVRDNLEEWLSTATALLKAGEYVRAKLLFNTILQAHPACVQAHVQLVQTLLHLEQSLWPKALQVARCACWFWFLRTRQQTHRRVCVGGWIG